MESNSKAVLDEMIKSVITRDGKGTADTMLVSSHLSQMKMFGIRQGVEFYPQQDNFGTQRFDVEVEGDVITLKRLHAGYVIDQ